MEEGSILNIFELAQSNTNYLKEEYEKILKQYANKISNIKDWEDFIINNYNISMNTSESGIFGFLNDGRYKNVHDLVSEGIKKLYDNEEIMEYEKRKVFDYKFEKGKAFKYGALFIGGCGVREYGRFCMVINKNDFEKLCFVKRDSLKCYIRKEEDGHYVIDMDKLKKHLSDKNNVHLLTVIKHHEDLVNKNDEEEIKFVICGDNYIEAITDDDITPENIMKIVYLIDKELREYLEKYELLCDYDILSLLRRISLLMDDDKVEKEKLENLNIDAKDMRNIIKMLNKLNISFEIYVEYDDENPKKVWDNENNSN